MNVTGKLAGSVLSLLMLPMNGCAFFASTQSAPVSVAAPSPGVATAPEPTLRLKFGPRFDPNAMTAVHFDDFEFHVSDFCPRPKADGTSIKGAGSYVKGTFTCAPNYLYYWPDAVHGMPHWHTLSVDYARTTHAFIFKPPYLVLSPARRGVPSESVSFGTLEVSRAGRRPFVYAERVAVERPAPANGIAVTLSDMSSDVQICTQNAACGRAGASVTIPAGVKSATFYLSPFRVPGRTGKHRFAIAAVAEGCETGRNGGTILYEP